MCESQLKVAAASARLVDEVRTGEVRPAISRYNRAYNRHNR
jgi:hypothetical protein